MPEYKLLVADIDGTVVDHGSNGKEVNVEHPAKIAISRAQTLGKVVTFATGRNFPKAKPVIEAFEITDPVIVNGGSQIVDPSDESILWEKRINASTAKQICTFVTKQSVDPDLLIGFGYIEEWLFSQIEDRRMEKLIYLDLIGFSDDKQVKEILGFVSQFDDAAGVAVPSPQFTGRKNVMVTNAQATKYHAMLELQKIVGASKAETIAVGDGKNDLPLFDASGLKAAVDNGDNELKAIADLIVNSVDEHGIVEVIEDYLIQRN